MKYRKKPVVIEAFRYGFDKIPEWGMEAKRQGILTPYSQFGGEVMYCEIKTLEGTMRGEGGDYIIQGVNNEIYPCKPDIFHKTYDKVEEENS